MRTAAPPHDSKRMLESMRVVNTDSCKRGGTRAERLESGADVEARESGISFVPRMGAVDKLNSVKEALKKMKENQYSSIVSSQLKQKERKRVREY